MKEVIYKYFKGDIIIWGIILGLSLFSLLAVYSSTGTLAYKYQSGNTVYYFIKHTGFLLFGIAIVFVTHSIPYRYFSRLAQLMFFISIPLLVLTLITGVSLNQASRWLTVPGLDLTFQTSDFAKLALIMYLARLLAMKQENIKNFREAFRPILIPILITSALILPANFSTAALIFVTSLILLFVGRINLLHLGAFIGISVVAVGLFSLMIWNYPTVLPRGETWKNRMVAYFQADSEGNYQAEQSKIAVATGGIFGKLPGNSTQRNFLPHPYSDFIFAIIVEEYGLVGGFVLILLYLVLLYRAGIIVKKSTSLFAAFLALGLTISLVFQALINMGVAVNIFPVTGQTLPLVSMGGSSILFTCVSLGIILSVSRTSQPKEEEHEQAK